MPSFRTRIALVRSAELHGVARASIAGWTALSIVLASGCTRSEQPPAPVASVTPTAVPVVETPTAPSPAIADVSAAPQTSPPKADPTTSTACNTDADCRTFSDACGICSCRPFAKTSPDPKCPGSRMTCLMDPCTGLRSICRKGNCAIGDPGDAAALDATAGATKDAAAAPTKDAAGAKSTDAATSTAASATPKVADAALRD